MFLSLVSSMRSSAKAGFRVAMFKSNDSMFLPAKAAGGSADRC